MGQCWLLSGLNFFQNPGASCWDVSNPDSQIDLSMGRVQPDPARSVCKPNTIGVALLGLLVVTEYNWCFSLRFRDSNLSHVHVITQITYICYRWLWSCSCKLCLYLRPYVFLMSCSVPSFIFLPYNTWRVKPNKRLNVLELLNYDVNQKLNLCCCMYELF
jgi:hypothetical protein